MSLLPGAPGDAFARMPILVSLPALDEASLCFWFFAVLAQVRIGVCLFLITALR